MLEVTDLSARFGQAEVVRGVTLRVDAGEAVALVGGNGAGKTTLLRTIAGLHQERRGTVTVDGDDLSDASTVSTARAGVVLVPQGRRLFASLTVAEHIRLAESRRPAAVAALTKEDVFEFFPQLAERRNVRAGYLSGGEQQMLAITRAVLQRPRYVLLDEPTEGLSPAMVEVVSRLVTELPKRGLGLLITEQTAGSRVLDSATRHLTMDRGELHDSAEVAPAPHILPAPAPERLPPTGDSTSTETASWWQDWLAGARRRRGRPQLLGDER